MKELTTMPILVTEGNEGFEVYEYADGFCMTPEFLGKCIGYSHPLEHMRRLFRRHKDALEQHRFRITGDTKPQGGRRSFFYDIRKV